MTAQKDEETFVEINIDEEAIDNVEKNNDERTNDEKNTDNNNNENTVNNSNNNENTDKKDDELDPLNAVGSFGRFQQLVIAIFCVIVLFPVYHITITYFIADIPSWRCIANSATCRSNATFTNKDLARCSMKRSEWEYTMAKSYSIITQWDLDCDRKWLSDLVTSIFFLGWIIGAPIIGWISDNVGRRIILIHTVNVILLTSILSAFVPNIFYFIGCRFVIGFCMNGTYPLMMLIITGIVGDKYQTYTSLTIFAAVMVGLSILGIKSLFITEWKFLYVACSVPYIVTIPFLKFVPESLSFLQAKGKQREMKELFQRMAYWNKKNCPSYIASPQQPQAAANHVSNPLELFKTRKLALATSLPAVITFFNIVVYYGLYFQAGDLGGSLHRDYLIITAPEALFSFLNVYFSDKFGLQKMTLCWTSISSLACVGLIFTAGNDALKTVNIFQGMLGKCCNGVAFSSLTSWATTLIPAHLRSEAMSIGISVSRMGGLAAPWMISCFSELYFKLPFITMSIMGVLSCLLIVSLMRFEIAEKKKKAKVVSFNEGNAVEAYTNVVVELEV